jgi:DNA-binding PadR family transcriptional regulator
VERPVERLKRKIERENLWIFVLSSLEEGKRYGYELRKLIKEKFGFLTGNVTAYKVLYLLKIGGYIKSEKMGRHIYYEITLKGKEELMAARKALKCYLKKI